MSYFNTTHVLGQRLYEYIAEAKCQEEKILRLFLAYPTRKFSPSEVKTFCFSLNNTPLTSVRRAMTNLTNEDDLVKTFTQKKGRYGRHEYCWQLAFRHTQGKLPL